MKWIFIFEGDTETNRPVIIYIGGSYLGDKSMTDCVDFVNLLRRGYVWYQLITDYLICFLLSQDVQ